MTRYLRLYGHFVRFAFSRALTFRFDFFFRVGMDVLWYAQYFAYFVLLGSKTPTLGGWTASQVRVFAGTLFLYDAIQMTLLANNLWAFPAMVNKGELDHHLLRPVSPLFVVSLRDFAANSFLNLLVAVGIQTWILSTYDGPLDAPRLLLYLVLVPVGVFLHWCLHMLFLMPVFWTQTARGFRDLSWAIDAYNARPVGIYRGWMRRLLTTVLPLGLVVSFPTRVIVEGPSLAVPLQMLVVAVAFGLIVRFVWARGLRAYGSASS
jgi:ABC-2 type transport system permease protein